MPCAQALFNRQKNSESKSIAAKLQITGIYYGTNRVTMAENSRMKSFYARALSIFPTFHFMMQNM
jgi:hypothetical protein